MKNYTKIHKDYPLFTYTVIEQKYNSLKNVLSMSADPFRTSLDVCIDCMNCGCPNTVTITQDEIDQFIIKNT